MEVTASLFAFILFIAPGAVAVQTFFTSQRLSVVYADTAFEKILAAVLVAPICHGVAVFIINLIDNALWSHSPFEDAFQKIVEAFYLTANLGAGNQLELSQANAEVFLAYFVWSLVVAAVTSFFATKLTICFGGAPGYRDGIYSVVNGFLKTSVTASVVTEIPSSDDCVLLFNGTVDKISYSKSGDIQFIYLSEPTRTVMKIAPKSEVTSMRTPGKVGRQKGSFKSFKSEMAEERLIGQSMLFGAEDFYELDNASERIESATAANEALFTGRFMIDGTHIKNIFFVRYLAPEQPIKSFLIRRFPNLFPKSDLRLRISEISYSELGDE